LGHGRNAGYAENQITPGRFINYNLGFWMMVNEVGGRYLSGSDPRSPEIAGPDNSSGIK